MSDPAALPPVLITFDRLYYAGKAGIDPTFVLSAKPGDDTDTFTVIHLLGGARVRVIGAVADVKAKLGLGDLPLDMVPTL